jgi:hypothetical protein
VQKLCVDKEFETDVQKTSGADSTNFWIFSVFIIYTTELYVSIYSLFSCSSVGINSHHVGIAIL